MENHLNDLNEYIEFKGLSALYEAVHKQHYQNQEGKIVSVYFFMLNAGVKEAEQIADILNLMPGNFSTKKNKLTYRLDIVCDSMEETKGIAYYEMSKMFIAITETFY